MLSMVSCIFVRKLVFVLHDLLYISQKTSLFCAFNGVFCTLVRHFVFVLLFCVVFCISIRKLVCFCLL